LKGPLSPAGVGQCWLFEFQLALLSMMTRTLGSVEAVRAASRDEARQLHDAVRALRAEADQLRFDHAAALERQRQAAQDELRQLRQTLALLRSEAERVRAG